MTIPFALTISLGEVSNSTLLSALFMKSKIKDFIHQDVLKGLQVLVVDDEHYSRMLCTTILEKVGASVIAVTSVESALETLSKRQLDILISDIQMPGEDGFNLIKRLRSRQIQRREKIIATAAMIYQVTECASVLLAGFQDYIFKPIEPVEMIGVVADLSLRSRSAEKVESD